MGDCCNSCNSCNYGGIFSGNTWIWIVIAIIVIVWLSGENNNSCC